MFAVPKNILHQEYHFLYQKLSLITRHVVENENEKDEDNIVFSEGGSDSDEEEGNKKEKKPR